MRGWLAWINRANDVRRQVPAYQELLQLFSFFSRWHVVPMAHSFSLQIFGISSRFPIFV